MRGSNKNDTAQNAIHAPSYGEVKGHPRSLDTVKIFEFPSLNLRSLSFCSCSVQVVGLKTQGTE